MSTQEDSRRIYMYFQFRDGWHCQFLEQDLKTPLPRQFNFASSDKVIRLVERGCGFIDQETRMMVNQGIEKGRGGVFLSLTNEQYIKLKR